VQKRKTVRAGFVELQWKPFFDRIESSRLRRGKSGTKQGLSVSELTVQGGVICAQVKGGGFRADNCVVKLPAVDRWDAYLDQVAIWLSRRPDWLAALLAQNWDMSFLEFVSETGLKLFPDEQTADLLVSQASCTCSDWEKPCQHIVAVVYDMVRNMESTPLRAFEYVGVVIPELLNRVHQQSVDSADVGRMTVETPEHSVGGVALWPEEQVVLVKAKTEVVDSLKHRIRPQLDHHKFETWKKDYMAWK
jgi:uncharacterized Zn finger protein